MNDWNQKPNKCETLNLYGLQQFFLENNINNEYFDMHNLKCFRTLLKMKCNIKASAVNALWYHIKPHPNDAADAYEIDITSITN